MSLHHTSQTPLDIDLFLVFFRQNKDKSLNELVEHTPVRMHLLVSHLMHAWILYVFMIVFVSCVYVY